MLNPHLKLPDCYKTKIKVNISKCAPSHTKNPSVLLKIKVFIILR